MKRKMTVMTLVMAVVMLAATLLVGQYRPKPFDIGDYSHVVIEEAEAQFEASQSNEDLVYLCKALSWYVEVAGEEEAKDKLNRYGQQLLDRAKEETIDLETADNPDIMLAVLRVIRETGAK